MRVLSLIEVVLNENATLKSGSSSLNLAFDNHSILTSLLDSNSLSVFTDRPKPTPPTVTESETRSLTKNYAFHSSHSLALSRAVRFPLSKKTAAANGAARPANTLWGFEVASLNRNLIRRGRDVPAPCSVYANETARTGQRTAQLHR